MSGQRDDVERLRQAFAALAEEPVVERGCPEPERLWDAARGELPPRQLRRIVDHTVSCAACAEAWRLARELGGGPEPAAAEAERSSPPWWAWPRLPMAAAAAVVVLVAGLQLRQSFGPPDNFRDPAVEGIRSLVPEGQPLPRRSCVLRWSAAGDGALYNLRVTTEQLAVITEVWRLQVPEHRLAEEDLRQLESGARLLWRVEAVSPDGGRQLSETFVVHLE